MQPHLNPEKRNLAGLTPAEQNAKNANGFRRLREIFAKAGSSLDASWMTISKVKKAAILGIARLPQSLMTSTLSALPYQQRDAIRLAVMALGYQQEFTGGCDPKLWHPSAATAATRDIER